MLSSNACFVVNDDNNMEVAEMDGYTVVEVEENESDFREDGELRYVRVVETTDREVERTFLDPDAQLWDPNRYVTDDNCQVDQSHCYWTTSGDSPVIFSEAEVVDQNRSAGGWSDLEPEWVPSFYSAAKPSYSKQFHNYNVVCVWIFNNRANKETLQRGWSKFWRRFFSEKAAGTVSNWLMPWHVTRIKCEFNKYGVKSQSSK